MYERSVSAPLDNASDRTEPDECLASECLDSTDPAAWERLLDRYSWLVQTVIRRYHLSPEDEADVYQDVCLSCWRELPTLRDRTRLGRWIATIASRRALDARRRLYPSAVELTPLEHADVTSLVERLVDGAPGPDEEIARSEVVERVRAAVTQLPARQRELVSALFFEEDSYAEIASRLGYSIDSIGAIRGRCFRTLRSILHELESK